VAAAAVVVVVAAAAVVVVVVVVAVLELPPWRLPPHPQLPRLLLR
jgi:hypothetical protein